MEKRDYYPILESILFTMGKSVEIKTLAEALKLTQEEIIEYKKLGILPLNINENGIDIDTKEFIAEFCNQFEKEMEMRGVIKK